MPKRSATVPKSPKLGVIHHDSIAQPSIPVRVRTSNSTEVSSLTHQTSKTKVRALKPFERDTLAGGSEASTSIKVKSEAKKKMIEEETTSKANGFKARPLPKTTSVKALKSKDVNVASVKSVGKVSMLKSTVRSRQRAVFEAKRLRKERARQTKEEIKRIEKCMEEREELEQLREQIKMPR
ncbi:hypothetical protein TrST_g2201 [Triparma strigata]|uniref:Uncharacterized protein n=1 Tax=Triparma strigata TaxID=1606541 RepID=A0A9W7ETG2_9STRA|nr:hypothetical protein TrST_g2201 [Triparma strigata]